MAKFGAAYGVRQGIHVGVDVLVNRIGDKARKPVIVFALLCGALFTFTIGTFGGVFVYNMSFTDQTSPDLELPMWLVYLAIPARLLSDVLPVLAGRLDLFHDRRDSRPWTSPASRGSGHRGGERVR